MMSNSIPINLTCALQEGRIAEFIDQEEARGVRPDNLEDLERILRIASTTEITPPRSPDHTSRSRSHDGSTGKQTR